jgi:DNA-binding response OmpR family regulator
MTRLAHPKRRILIIDDDESICTMLRTFFETFGFEVETRLSSLNVFQDLESVKADIILLDVMMSWLDGYRVCRLLKSHPRTKDIPVLMISARSGDEDIKKGLAAKAEDYFVKPFNLAQLRGRIDELLTDRLPN